MGIDKAKYMEAKRLRAEAEERTREHCVNCRLSRATCYCARLRPFEAGIKFVILIHPHEARRRIATGRMSHLCLRDSLLVEGEDFSNHTGINAILQDERYQPVILYPGLTSINLSEIPAEKRQDVFRRDRELVVFVIDGTWRTARKMLRLSRNLQSVQRVCFSPPSLSRFRIRKQPAPECFSTIEAIHHMIDLLGPLTGVDLRSRTHDRLLEVFDSMVNFQLTFVTDLPSSRQT